MDVNEYMKRSLELLESIDRKLGGTEQVVVRANVADLREAVRDAAEKARPEVREQKIREQEAAGEKTVAGKKPKADDVRRALMELGQREGADAAIALLKKYGATSVSSLKEDDYASVITDCAP